MGACAQSPAPAANEPGFSFIVIGDTPYSAQDEAMLNEALPLIKSQSYTFVIHVGDYKGGGQQCLKQFDDRLEQVMNDLSPIPVFYTPGDNEWTDCDRHTDPDTGEKYSDLERLEIVRARFASGIPAGAGAFGYRRQEALKENATWAYGGVRFLTMHVTGTNNGRDWVTVDAIADAAAAANQRDAANLAWLDEGFEKAADENASAVVIAFQADPTDIADKPDDVMCDSAAESDQHPCDAFTDLRRALQHSAEAFKKPVLVIHGDTSPFTLNQDFDGEEAENLWRLNAAGDAGTNRAGVRYGLVDVAKVTISSDETSPFSAEGLLTGIQPSRK
ncbi:metallophosphoesterase [Hyphococcus flavus]|uniref:Metallophosphoesterase n=1 Tax=Hyphococcus flavus TaxID=1866326 RepID=A0AAE9ZE99_9PROT|nr:metallophosphoesterase [Hyphococcus flavus]WDI31462.1 metallophosphoesterase [Hyphococcus flavus]